MTTDEMHVASSASPRQHNVATTVFLQISVCARTFVSRDFACPFVDKNKRFLSALVPEFFSVFFFPFWRIIQQYLWSFRCLG